MKRLPRSFDLPGGYGITVVRGDAGLDTWGAWDPDTRTITLDRTLKNLAQARYIFLHEMEHAFTDWKKWVAAMVGIENPDGPVDEPAEEA